MCCRHNATTLERFQYSISKHELYHKDDPLVDQLLHDMATQKILHVSEYRGTSACKTGGVAEVHSSRPEVHYV